VAKDVGQEQRILGGHVSGAEHGVGPRVAVDVGHPEVITEDRHVLRWRFGPFDVASRGRYEALGLEVLAQTRVGELAQVRGRKRKSTRLNSSHDQISYAVFCLKKKNSAAV